MSEPYLGQIMITSFNFAPKSWAYCNGQLMPIIQNQALFSLLGTMYGGDGRVTFALPDFRGRVAVGDGTRPGDPYGFVVGQVGGSEYHSLTPSQVNHSHAASSTTEATKTSPAGAVWATGSAAVYGANANAQMAAGLVGNTGGSQPHYNMQPHLVLSFVIALTGIFPSTF